MFVCGTTRPNKTKLNQTNQTKLNQSQERMVQSSIQTKPKQTSQNQTFSTINSKLTALNKIQSKVPEKLARAVQLLYRPVLVSFSFCPIEVQTHKLNEKKIYFNLLVCYQTK